MGNLELRLVAREKEPAPQVAEQSMFRIVRKQEESKAALRYYATAARVTDEWEHTKKACTCDVSRKQRKHHLIRFKSEKVWYAICPIHYYILWAWQAQFRRTEMPSEGLYWELLNVTMPTV
jgi:hypothetical protein